MCKSARSTSLKQMERKRRVTFKHGDLDDSSSDDNEPLDQRIRRQDNEAAARNRPPRSILKRKPSSPPLSPRRKSHKGSRLARRSQRFPLDRLYEWATRHPGEEIE